MKNIPSPISIFRWETEGELRKALLPQATQPLSTGVREGTGSPDSHPQLLARSSVQKSSNSSLSEQCVLFLGTLTTEGKFFLQEENLGGELPTRKGCVAIQRDVLKCLGLLEQRPFGSRYHCVRVNGLLA